VSRHAGATHRKSFPFQPVAAYAGRRPSIPDLLAQPLRKRGALSFLVLACFGVTMRDRRQEIRFLLNQPLEGTLDVFDDVVVERYVNEEMTVLASMAARPNDVLIVDRVATGSAGTSRVRVRVTESGPAVVDGRLRHRLTLRADRSPVDGRPRVLGGLRKTVPVKLLDVCEGGCQLESTMPVEHGLYAELEIAFPEGIRREPLRISRCQMVPGATCVFRMGAQFSPAGPSGQSFCRALMRQRSDPLNGNHR
jgi:hypothetical protein